MEKQNDRIFELIGSYVLKNVYSGDTDCHKNAILLDLVFKGFKAGISIEETISFWGVKIDNLEEFKEEVEELLQHMNKEKGNGG